MLSELTIIVKKMNNTPTLIDSEEKETSWNNPFEGSEEYKTIEVTISETLSSIQKLQVPVDFDETDKRALEALVVEEIILPSDCMVNDGYFDWITDDFCVTL